MNNIIFESIKIEGFLSLGEVEIPLKEQGFTLVKGINNESKTVQSNGSGKSAIWDALFYCLTGETLRGSSLVVNEKLTDSCTVLLTFHDQFHNYQIRRSKNHKVYGNSCQFIIDDSIISDQIKRSNEEIAKVLPSVSNPEVLGSIILLGQGLPYKFSSFSPIKRKEILEIMSGSTTEIDQLKYKLDILSADTSGEHDRIQKEIMRLSGLISGYETTITLLNSQIENHKTKEEVNQRVVELTNELNHLNEVYPNKSNELERIQQKISSYNDSISKLSETLISYNNSVNLILGQLSSYKSGSCPTCGRPYEIDQSIEDQKIILNNKVNQFKTKINELETERSRFRNELYEHQNKLNQINQEIQQIRINQYNLENEKKNLNSQSDEINLLNSQIEEINQKIIESKIKLNDLSKENLKVEETLECISYLKRQLSRDFKGYILEEVIKYMSSRSEYYSSYLFTNKKKIKINLSSNKILINLDERPYENLSGGERQRVDLAVQFSLRDMLMTTSGFFCNLLVLDEVFDNLDSQGSDALMKLIISEFSEIDSVFIVTHHSEIDIPYDNQITIIKNSDGISYQQ